MPFSISLQFSIMHKEGVFRMAVINQISADERKQLLATKARGPSEKTLAAQQEMGELINRALTNPAEVYRIDLAPDEKELSYRTLFRKVREDMGQAEKVWMTKRAGKLILTADKAFKTSQVGAPKGPRSK